MPDRWRLEGYDTFSDESYPLGAYGIDDYEPDYGSYAEARADALRRLDELDRTQPGAGGQHGIGAIQDQVYVVHPSGRRERVDRAVKDGDDDD